MLINRCLDIADSLLLSRLALEEKISPKVKNFLIAPTFGCLSRMTLGNGIRSGGSTLGSTKAGLLVIGSSAGVLSTGSLKGC